MNDFDVAEKLFSVHNAQVVDQVFEALSPSRKENVAYYAEKFANHYFTRQILKDGFEQSRADLEDEVEFLESRTQLQKMAQICLNIYWVRGPYMSEPMRTFAEALDQLPDMDLAGPGIKKAYHALINKIEEEHGDPPPPPPQKKRKWGRSPGNQPKI